MRFRAVRSSSLSSHCLLDPRLTSPAGLLDYSIVMAKICLCLIKQLVKSNITKTFSLYKSPYFHVCFSGRKKLEMNQINNFILINFAALVRQLHLTSSGTPSLGTAASLSLSEEEMRSRMTSFQQMWKRCGKRCVVPGVTCIQKCCAFKAAKWLLNIYLRMLFTPARLRLLRELQVRKTIMMTKRNKGRKIQRLKGSMMSMTRMVWDTPGFFFFFFVEMYGSELNCWSLILNFFLL